MCAKKLNHNVTSAAIMQVVNRATKELAGSKLGSEVSFRSMETDIKTQLWGFNSSRSCVVVELSINNIMLEKITLKRDGGDFAPTHRVDPAYRYSLIAKGVIPAR